MSILSENALWWDGSYAILNEPVQASIEIEVPRKSKRVKKGARPAREKQSKRQTILFLRWMKVLINPPENGIVKGQSPVEMWILDAREKNPPEGESVLLVAKLGGYLARKHDPPPGAEILWRGSRKLTTWCEFASFSPILE